jgi:ATP-binding cassette subfamily B protein/subfamily B ATP-binding cassette protein MsbA
VLLILTGAALSALKPWPLKLIVDYVLPKQALPESVAWITSLPGVASQHAQLVWLAAVTIVIFLAGQALTMVQSYIEAGVANRMVYDLGLALFDRLQRFSLRFHSRQRTGDLVRRVTTDSTCVRELVLNVYIPLLTSLATMVMMFFVMWRLDRILSLVALSVTFFFVYLIRRLERPIAERAHEHQRLEGEMMALAEQTLTALPVVQAFTREEHEDERFRGLSQRTLTAYLRSLTTQLLFKTGIDGATGLGTAAILAVGGYRVLEGSLSLGSLLVFLAYLSSLFAPLETLAQLGAGLAAVAGKAQRVMELLDEQDAVHDLPAARPMPTHGTNKDVWVRLEDVTFGYDHGRPVLRGINLEARPGETLALVGPTGAGKSTLVSLIPRFFDPWQGRVVLNGIDARQFQIASLRARVAIVLQDPFLLPLSVAENIAYGRPGASHDEIVRAASAANAHEFIRRLPNGYQTVVGERGANLSGGERQRIAIARALLKDSPVLILDEPTSSLDAQTESQLLEALERLLDGRTTFVIAHRLSTIRQADRIVVLEEGRVVETGSRQELLAAEGSYHRLHQLQYGHGSSGYSPQADSPASPGA